MGLRKTGGRNNHGRTTVWHRGGGSKRLYRFVRAPQPLLRSILLESQACTCSTGP